VNLVLPGVRSHEGGPISMNPLTGGGATPAAPAERGDVAMTARTIRPQVAQLTDMVATEHATTTQPARWDE
jgi:hypothetical protein